MKTYWMQFVSLLCMIYCLSGCKTSAPVISVQKPMHPIRVQTENIQWNVANESDQELADEI